MSDESGKKRVVIVEDSATMRGLVRRQLMRDGRFIVVGEAEDPYEAREVIKQTNPDVLTLDVEMPRMDGFDFLRSLRADPRYQALPVIMITSRTADKHREHALELGANAYLGKPYDEGELLRLLASFCPRPGRG